MECGYPTPSIRERIYVGELSDKKMCGVLIYTTSTDKKGTLGGLIAQASDESILREHIQAIKEDVRRCSQDPLCSIHMPSEGKEANAWGASCHSCMHVPETSCERLQNRLLDRHVLVSPSKDRYRGFLDGLD